MTPSAGALRAARALLASDYISEGCTSACESPIGIIIDRESGLSECIEALKLALNAAVHIGLVECGPSCRKCKIESALSKVSKP